MKSLIAPVSILGMLVLFYSQVSADDRQPVPAAVKQQELRTLLRNDLFKAEYAAAKTPAKQQELAQQLFSKAASSADDRAGQFVLLRESLEMAAGAGDVPLAMRAADELGRTFAVSSDAVKTKALELASKAPNPKQHGRALATAAEQVIAAALADDDFAAAKHLLEIAQAGARSAGDKELVKQLSGRGKDIDEAAADYEQIKKSLATLNTSPKDPDANVTVGKYRCFVKEDWATGVQNLTLGNDAALKAAAGNELVNPSSAEGKLKAADAWWDIAATQRPDLKARIQAHAAKWYERALPDATGLNKERAEKRITDAARMPPGAVLVFAFEKEDIVRKVGGFELKDRSGAGNNGEIVGTATLVPQGKIGSALLIDGKEAHVAVPHSESLNFETFTFSAWVNFNKRRDGGMAGGQVILQKKEALKFWVDTFGWMRVEFKGEDGFHGITNKGGTQWKPTPGKWTHLVGVFDGEKAHIYADGGEVSVSNPIKQKPVYSDAPLMIGQKDWTFSSQLDGAVDELAIFNRAISEQEVAMLYRMGKRGKSVGAK